MSSLSVPETVSFPDERRYKIPLDSLSLWGLKFPLSNPVLGSIIHSSIILPTSNLYSNNFVGDALIITSPKALITKFTIYSF